MLDKDIPICYNNLIIFVLININRKDVVLMKRIVGVLLAGTMALSLAGCGGSDTDTASTSGTKYIIATDTAFPPFEFTDASGSFTGIDVELVAAIAEDQGFAYEMQPLGFDAALTAVQSGQADGMIAGMSITEERKEQFDFSDPYYSADVTIAVAPGSDIDSFEDLKGSKVAVKTGTNGSDYAKSIADEYDLTITEFKDSPTMYQDVITGNTVACFEDYPVMAYNVQQGAQLVIPDGCTAAGSDYGFAVKKGNNAELLAMFQQGLANIKANGKYQEIIDKYTK